MAGKRRDYRPRFKKEEQHLWASLIKDIKKIGVAQAMSIFSGKGANTKETQTFEGEKWEIVQDATPISTKEQLIERCKIDTNVWDIPKFQVSSWGQNGKSSGYVQLFSIKAVLVKKSISSLDRFLTKLEKGKYKIPKVNLRLPSISNIERCAILNLSDAHLDKVTRETECGEFSDITKNCAIFKDAFFSLLNQVDNPSIIYFPIGNDLFNVNDTRNTTKAGTHQDTVMHHVDAFEIVLNLLIGLINEAAKIAPIHIPMIAGNHDTDAIHLLGVVLSKIYEKSECVVVDYRRLPRKYIQYGKNMFLFEHGDGLKMAEIPQIMANERPEMWCNTKHRYAFLGHLHQTKNNIINRTQDHIGVEVRHQRALSAKDNWHFKKGYTGIPKSAEMIITSKDGKYYNIHRVNF